MTSATDAPESIEREFAIPLSAHEQAMVRVRLAANTPVVRGPGPRRYHAGLGDGDVELDIELEIVELMGNTPVVGGPRPVDR